MDLEELREAWHRASEKDKPQEAIKLLIQLEKLEPLEPRWSQRLAECYRRTGHKEEAVEAFVRAFHAYFDRGFLPRAIAMAKLVGTLDAARGDLLEKSLAKRGGAVPPPLVAPPPLAKGPPPLPASASAPAPAPAPAKIRPPPLPPTEAAKPARGAPPPLPPSEGLKATKPPPLPTPAPHLAPLPLSSLRASALPASALPLPLSRSLPRIVRPTPLSLAPDSSVDEVRFSDDPDSSVEILLVDFANSDVISLDADDEELPPTMPRIEPLPEAHRGSQPAGARADAQNSESSYAYGAMASFRLFAALSKDALVALAAATELVEFVPGAMIIVRDERAFALYAIVSGTARVTVLGSPEIRLGDGDVFGEGSLLDEGKRQADVRAETPLMTLRVEKRALDEVTKAFPEIGDALFDLLARRLIMNLMHTSPLFTSFEPAVRLELAQKFEVRRADAGTIIAERGRRSDGLYILLAGNVTAEREPGQGPATRVARGTAFGHASLLGSGAQADVTIRAATEAILLRMPATGFAALAATYPPALAHLAETAGEPIPMSRRD